MNAYGAIAQYSWRKVAIAFLLKLPKLRSNHNKPKVRVVRVGTSTSSRWMKFYSLFLDHLCERNFRKSILFLPLRYSNMSPPCRHLYDMRFLLICISVTSPMVTWLLYYDCWSSLC